MRCGPPTSLRHATGLYPEDVRGAIPFYTGRIVRMLDDEDAVTRYAEAHPDQLLLVGGKDPVHPGGGHLRGVWSGHAPESVYVLVRASDL